MVVIPIIATLNSNYRDGHLPSIGSDTNVTEDSCGLEPVEILSFVVCSLYVDLIEAKDLGTLVERKELIKLSSRSAFRRHDTSAFLCNTNCVHIDSESLFLLNETSSYRANTCEAVI